MEFKKLIFVLAIAFILIIGGMWGTSYAYYVSTDGVDMSVSTPDFDPNVAVVFNQNQYIDIETGVPIAPGDVDEYASKSTFTLIPNKKILNTSEVAVNISLMDVTIDQELKRTDFKYKLDCNDGTSDINLGSGTGSDITTDTISLGSLSTTNSTFNISNTYNCTISIWLHETGQNQNNLMGKHFSGLIKVDTMFKGGKVPRDFANEKISNLFSKTATVTEGDGITVDDIDITHQLIKDPLGNIRYYGTGISDSSTEYKEPNNYIDIGDNTLWRIIGVFKDVELSDGTKKDLIKVMRSESIGGYSWDTGALNVNAGRGINQWGPSTYKSDGSVYEGADLMRLLNPKPDGTSYTGVNGSLYWNSQSGTCYNNHNNATISCDFRSRGLANKVKSKIAEVKWNLGGVSSYSIYPNAALTMERGDTVYSGVIDGITRQTTWIGKIAIPYLSDYGYATDLLQCSQNLYYYNSSTYACRGNNWMWYTLTGATTASRSGSRVAWLLTNMSPYCNSACVVEDSGFVSSSNVSFGYNLMPVLYLSSETIIESGIGTESNPYVLSD